MILSLLVSIAHASTGNFTFAIDAAGPKCAHLTYATIEPTYPSRRVKTVRFYYGSGSVTQNSPYFVSNVSLASGDLSLTPIKFCGLPSGHMNFKYALIDAAGAILEFMPEGDFNPDINGTDIP